MIKGHGIDLVEIKRLEHAVKRWGKTFLNRVFTEQELKYSEHKARPMQHLAARFAAKEAIYKAFGTNPKLNFKDIEIYNDRYGRPFCKVKNKSVPVYLAISHTDTHAIASAIIEEKA
ncbi:MAG: holo-ACP synthase [Candidatus Omnitrophota bacterium]